MAVAAAMGGMAIHFDVKGPLSVSGDSGERVVGLVRGGPNRGIGFKQQILHLLLPSSSTTAS
jgi:hypothetical protein